MSGSFAGPKLVEQALWRTRQELTNPQDRTYWVRDSADIRRRFIEPDEHIELRIKALVRIRELHRACPRH